MDNEKKEVIPQETTPETGKGEQMVEIPKKQLDNILSRLSAMEKGGVSIVPKRITENMASIRLVNGNPIVKWGKIYNKLDAVGEKEMWAEVYIQDEEEKQVVKYLDFLNEPNTHTVKIVKKTADEIKDVVGYITPTSTDPAEISGKQFTDPNTIEQVVESVVYTYEVEVIGGEYEGKKFTVGEVSLNT